MEKARKLTNEVTSIRLKEKERHAVEKIMKSYGFWSVSSCIRMLITKEANRIEDERRRTSW